MTPKGWSSNKVVHTRYLHASSVGTADEYCLWFIVSAPLWPPVKIVLPALSVLPATCRNEYDENCSAPTRHANVQCLCEATKGDWRFNITVWRMDTITKLYELLCQLVLVQDFMNSMLLYCNLRWNVNGFDWLPLKSALGCKFRIRTFVTFSITKCRDSLRKVNF